MSMPPTHPSISNVTKVLNKAPSQSRMPARAANATRKRTKAFENGADEEEEEKKRSRGRPRLDTKDETAADRRRTQIRLAQRAYRSRKDSAITTLERKVKDLEQVNENMGKEFMNFYDFVLSQGMLESAPEIARRLNDTTRKFLSFARKSTEDNSKDEFPDIDAPVQVSQAAETRRKGSKRSSSPASSPDGHSATSGSQVQTTTSGGASFIGASSIASSFQNFNAPTHLPYEVITQPTPENASFPVYDTQGQLPFFDNSFAASPFPAISAPSSYAFQERSFGRRLQRATLEAGLRLVSLENPPPHRYAAVFGFCLLFESREAIIRRLTISLSRTREESMYAWKYPFTNLGGAGFSLAGNDGSGSAVARSPTGREYPIGNQGVKEFYKPSEMTGFSMGPFSPEVEATRDDRVDHRMRMMYQGFEGDFYDADEVDVYLRQRGIVIPDHADFVDADIDISSFQEAPELRSSGGGPNEQRLFGETPVTTSGTGLPNLSSNSMGALGNMWPSDSTIMASSTMPNASMMPTPVGTGLGSLVPSTPVSGPPQYNSGLVSYGGHTAFPHETWAGNSAWLKTSVKIDVAQLLTEMVGRAVCLGRTPGLRQKDVDTAVRIASGLEHRP